MGPNWGLAELVPPSCRFGQHALGTATAPHRSGGHPACRRAGRLARRNRCSHYHHVENFGPRSGRQDATLYGRQDARRYLVAVSRRAAPGELDKILVPV
jgi:hypothetical protein